MSGFPLITAHSGCEGTCPNTIESIMAAIRSGADIVEIDVRATKDNIAILAHDESVDHPRYGKRLLCELAYSELGRLNPPVIRLDEALEIIRSSNRIANLDLKEDAVTIPVLKAIGSNALSDYVIFSGCEWKKAFFIAEQRKGLRVLLNTEEEMLLKCGYQNYPGFIEKSYRDAVGSACCGINISYEACFDELADYMNVRCLPVCVYTVDQPDLMRKYAYMGVYSITTNRVQMLSDLKRNNFHTALA